MTAQLELDYPTAAAHPYRHSCGDCAACNGGADVPCSWGDFTGEAFPHVGPECPGAGCGRPFPGCHRCGAPTACETPCSTPAPTRRAADPTNQEGTP